MKRLLVLRWQSSVIDSNAERTGGRTLPDQGTTCERARPSLSRTLPLPQGPNPIGIQVERLQVGAREDEKLDHKGSQIRFGVGTHSP